LAWHRELWRALDDEVAGAVRSRIDQRRARLFKQKSLAAGLASLGIKLKEKPGDPSSLMQKRWNRAESMAETGSLIGSSA